MNKFLIGGTVLVAALAVYLGVSSLSSNTRGLTDYGAKSDGATEGIQKAEMDYYTIAEVATHSDAVSCWTVVRDNIYDLTDWINQHPGGSEKILAMCGKDATEAFVGKHGGAMRPENELAGREIGKLAK